MTLEPVGPNRELPPGGADARAKLTREQRRRMAAAITARSGAQTTVGGKPVVAQLRSDGRWDFAKATKASPGTETRSAKPTGPATGGAMDLDLARARAHALRTKGKGRR